MIVDLYDAIDRMLWAIVAWIAVAAAIATPVVLLAAWAVTRAVKQAWRALSGCVRASGGMEGALDVHDAPDATQARTDDPGYEEAA